MPLTGVYGRRLGIQPPLGKAIVKTAEVRESPVFALGSGSSNRSRFVSWFTSSEVCRRNELKPKLEKTPLGSIPLDFVLLEYNV